MRLGCTIRFTAGALLSGIPAVLLVVVIVFPRVWSEPSVRQLPTLGQVLLADSHRYSPGISPASSKGPVSTDLAVIDYTPFEAQLGPGIYDAMAAHDDGIDGPIRSAILRYLEKHLKEPKARILLWKYRDEGDRYADWLIRRYTDSLPQGIQETLYYDKVDMPRKDEIRPDKSLDGWK